VRVSLLSSADDLRDLFAFRYRVYVDELGWLTPSSPVPAFADSEAFHSSLLVDQFDSVALNYAAFKDGRIVGSIRVVPDTPLGLPLETCSPLNGFRANKRAVELSRLCVTRDHRGSSLALLLMKAGWQAARRQGATHVLVDSYLDSTDPKENMYLRLGFAPISAPYTDPNYLIDDLCVSLAIECESAGAALPLRLRDFFTSPDSRIDHGILEEQ
jgi:predicted GNAT family N-acyltransferase